MTRRVRFTPFLRAGVFCAGAALLTAFEAHAADIPFATQPPISTTADNAESVVAADVDGDGDTDVVSASLLDDKLAWYENTAGDGSAWTTRTITTAADGAESVVAADVDGDGDTDVVSASFLDDKLAWYENAAGNGTAWTTRTITTAADGADAVFVGDVDGDGDLDLILGSSLDGTVAWYENTAGNGSAWTTRTITTQAGDPTGVAAGDVDGDGDLDVLSASGFGHSILWYENTSGAGTAWTTHTVATALYNARSVAAADVDGDGDTDVVAAVEIPGLVWYENAAGNGTTWTQRPVQTGAAEDAFVADLDRDGDLDVVSSSSAAVLWHENTAGDGTAWTSRTISTAATGVYSVSAADVDGDGDTDVLSASAGNDSVAWHRNQTIHESACFVQAPPISTTAGGAYSVTSADVDGDGDADVLAASRDDDKIAWHENLTGSGTPWAAHTITTAVDVAQGVVAADVDGDGDTDAFSTGYYAGLRWHRNDDGNGTAWTHVVFGATALGLTAADVDGDGDVDAIESTNFFDPFVKWYENTAGNGSAWSYRTITLITMGGPSHGVVAADLDGDGDTDVLSSIQFAGLLWFENVAGNGSTWTTRTVSASGDGGVVAADIDGDGDLDVASEGPGGAIWHENTAGNGTAWTPHAVGAGGSSWSLFVADLDRDGDADVLRAGTGASSVSWHENTAGNGLAWAPHVLLGGGGAGTSVSAADLDGDGDTDVLATTSNDDRVSWFQNRGGQFSLLASDTSPGGAMNGDVVGMLRVVVTHLGRAGDSDLELSSLGLLFEETAGDPLTSAEANALIENLQVYRDANGNGVFDPGTDTLVASVPTLALVNGVQTLAFTDNDPNLQVSLASPRTYFVVTELTASASTQSPNLFRVTHLGTGPWASTAEDRASDIRLRPACPEDVSASLGPITPVELMGFTVE